MRKVILKTTLCYRHILLSIKDGSKFANEMDMLIHLYIKIKSGLSIVITRCIGRSVFFRAARYPDVMIVNAENTSSYKRTVQIGRGVFGAI